MSGRPAGVACFVGVVVVAICVCIYLGVIIIIAIRKWPAAVLILVSHGTWCMHEDVLPAK
jgi:hypothetical protein